MQGDAGNLGFTVWNNAHSPVTPDDILDLEITLGPYKRSYRRSQLTFHDGRWLFPLSQEDSFGTWPGNLPCQVRVLWKSGVVEGKNIYGLKLLESISKEVLT